MQTHSTHQDWPAGVLLPEPSLMKQWAWRALAAAREEIHLAVESVMEDLESLSVSCSGMPGGAIAGEHADHDEPAGPSGILYELPASAAENDDDVLRVDDLVPPTPTRAGYETELPEAACKSDHGFEIIDWEDECEVLSFR